MAGKKFTRGAGKRLDAYGEQKIFDLYLKYRDVRKLLKNPLGLPRLALKTFKLERAAKRRARKK